MLHTEVIQLSQRFKELELHSAHSGREVLRVLQAICAQERQTTLAALQDELYENIDFLLACLPPYAPPLNRINQTLLILDAAQRLGEDIGSVQRKMAGLGEASTSPRATHEDIALHLRPALPDQAIIYTHTLSETVLGVLLQLHEAGNVRKVIVTESRPNNDGWVTARQLAQAGVPVELTIDAAMPAAVEAADLMLSGTEIINADGSVVGKIGAFNAAVLCEWLGRKLYIVGDTSKINALPRAGLQLTGFGAEGIGFEASVVAVTGSYFDLTPANLVHGYATERGLLTEDQIQTLAAQIEISPWLRKRLEGTSSILEKEKQP